MKYKNYIIEIEEIDQINMNGNRVNVENGNIPAFTYTFYIYKDLKDDYIEAVSYDSIKEGKEDIGNFIDMYLI